MVLTSTSSSWIIFWASIVLLKRTITATNGLDQVNSQDMRNEKEQTVDSKSLKLIGLMHGNTSSSQINNLGTSLGEQPQGSKPGLHTTITEGGPINSNKNSVETLLKKNILNIADHRRQNLKPADDSKTDDNDSTFKSKTVPPLKEVVFDLNSVSNNVDFDTTVNQLPEDYRPTIYDRIVKKEWINELNHKRNIRMNLIEGKSDSVNSIAQNTEEFQFERGSKPIEKTPQKIFRLNFSADSREASQAESDAKFNPTKQILQTRVKPGSEKKKPASMQKIWNDVLRCEGSQSKQHKQRKKGSEIKKNVGEAVAGRFGDVNLDTGIAKEVPEIATPQKSSLWNRRFGGKPGRNKLSIDKVNSMDE